MIQPRAWQWLNTGILRKKLPATAEVAAWTPLYCKDDFEAVEKQLWSWLEQTREALRKCRLDGERRVSAERLLANCRSAMRASQQRPELRTDWAHMIAAIDGRLKAYKDDEAG